MKLSVYTLIFSDKSIEEAAQTIAELGYDGIEIRIHTDGIPVSYTHLTLPTNREV